MSQSLEYPVSRSYAALNPLVVPPKERELGFHKHDSVDNGVPKIKAITTLHLCHEMHLINSK